MAKYLVVAHQTAASAELIRHLTRVASDDETACFTIVVPATEPGQLLVWEPGDATTIAQAKAVQAQALYEREGLKVHRSLAGPPSPVRAIAEELDANPGLHQGVILCTLPPGVSHWLGVDAPNIANEQFTVPVVHIVAGTAYR
jgi:hypothetical protein